MCPPFFVVHISVKAAVEPFRLAGSAASTAAVSRFQVGFNDVAGTSGCFDEIDLDGFHHLIEIFFDHESQTVDLKSFVTFV